MLIGLVIILALTLILPFCSKHVENNLEIFIFMMGLSASIISKQISVELVHEIFGNYLMYLITAAVLITGIIFKFIKNKATSFEQPLLKRIPLKVFIFLLITVLGLASSVITAIIASLLLVEAVHILPLDRKDKVNLNIIACFSIGMGAVLTPIGEPLSTIVTSRLDMGFWFLFKEVGFLIIPGVILLGVFGAWYVGRTPKTVQAVQTEEDSMDEPGSEYDIFETGYEEETYKHIIIRAGKILLFIIALELLGAGFKPVIDEYIIKLNSSLLYFGNMISAILDNATLAAAEISVKMTSRQIQSILMGLLISGGMLIPGNIPNIISAGKLKIRSGEWARLGIPLGLVVMTAYYVVIFVISGVLV